jgi:hypothetical protein
MIITSLRKSNCEGKQYTYPCSIASRPTVGPTQRPIQWEPGALSPGVKCLGSEADQSPPFNAKFKNGGAIPPLARTCS